MAEATKFVPKGILLDVDGTLTNSRKEIPPKTLKVIEKFSKAGIFCGVSTSRHYAFIKNYILPHFPKFCHHCIAWRELANFWLGQLFRGKNLPKLMLGKQISFSNNLSKRLSCFDRLLHNLSSAAVPQIRI